jgi:hypothetical protein
VRHEAHQINQNNEPVDPSHTDTVVRKHVAGLSISFFVAILIVLAAVIVGILVYTHTHHHDSTPSAPGLTGTT